MKNELKIGQVVWFAVNPMHMTQRENDPVFKGTIEKIKKTIETDEDGSTEKVEILVDTMCFETWLKSEELFFDKNGAIECAKAIITELQENRLKTDESLVKAFAAIGTDCD